MRFLISSTMILIAAFQFVAMCGITHAQSGSICSKPVESGVPASGVPASRAGDVQPSSDYAAAYTAILQQIVTESGMVRYDYLGRSLAQEFHRVLKAVEEFDAHSLASDEEKLAFWMNAYNVHMLQNILENPAVEDIVANGCAELFFTAPQRVAGQGITLDQIEHVILRGEEGPHRLEAMRVRRLDPRVHVGVNCAAVSCPPLRSRAFTAANVREELDRAMRDFLRSEHSVRMEENVMILSSIFDWFGRDFDRPGQPAGDFLLVYMSKERAHYAAIRSRLEGKTAKQIKVDARVRFEYNWSVNRAESGR